MKNVISCGSLIGIKDVLMQNNSNKPKETKRHFRNL